MSETPDCPHCGGETRYGKRESFHMSMGETPVVCILHGEVGYRDHDFGSFIMDKPTDEHTKGRIPEASG